MDREAVSGYSLALRDFLAEVCVRLALLGVAYMDDNDPGIGCVRAVRGLGKVLANSSIVHMDLREVVVVGPFDERSVKTRLKFKNELFGQKCIVYT